MKRWFSSALIGCALIVAQPALATTNAACVTNTFEVAWVHPGIYFYANPEAYGCTGASVRVKQAETGCFPSDAVAAGTRYYLAGEHAVSGECVHICETEQATTVVIFDLDNTYACAE